MTASDATRDELLRRTASSATPRFGSLARFCRGRLFQRLDRLAWGRLHVEDALGTRTFGAADAGRDEPTAHIEVTDPRFYRDVAAGGSVGAGESYVAGRWRADDLVAVVRVLVRNRATLDGLERGLARLGAALLRLWHSGRDNTHDGSRRNIAAHYDLGNEFYGLFLDRSRMYSCALFERADQTLEEAQLARLDRICVKLDLRPSDHVLEIGTGWGGFAIHAATTRGCRVTTTTISREQFEFASERVRELGLADRVTVLRQDYRDLRGRFDKAVSLEMIEAVGEKWLDRYFQTCSRLLAPDGMMLLQAITIRDHLYESALRSVDFIQRHVFPGSFIPSIAAMTDRLARVTDLTLFHLEDIGAHYATTVREWRRRFLARRDDVLRLGFDEAFIRLWEFYLCYCEGGFLERSIADVQMVLTKPLCRRAPIVPRLEPLVDFGHRTRRSEEQPSRNS